MASTSRLVASTCVFVLILTSCGTLLPAKPRRFAPRAAPRGIARRAGDVSGLGRLGKASQIVLSWATHHKAGAQIQPSSELVADGAVAILRLGVEALAVRTLVRMVYVVNDGHGKRFTYGKLPGH